MWSRLEVLQISITLSCLASNVSLVSNAFALFARKVLGLGTGSGAIGAATNVPLACLSSSFTTGFFDDDITAIGSILFP